MTILVVSLISGCGKKDDEASTEATEAASSGLTVQEEVVQMVNVDLPGIASDRNKAVAIYNDYFSNGGSEDSETWRSQLETEALTSYETYLNNLSALSYTNAEVQNLKDLYQKSSEYQRDAIQYVIDGIKDVDTDKLSEAQQAVSDSQTYMKMYENELERICSAYGISIVGEFGTASATDATATDAE